MSPEAVDYLAITKLSLERARSTFASGHYEDAARNAYLAALNATRALIFEKAGLAVKSHSGARSKLYELIHSGLPFDPGVAEFLQDGFDTKQGVDYGDGPLFVDCATAESYLARAEAFVAEARRVCS
jgi:Uncharacterized conserved protein related to C-terminal domain of eukaryotic chaperone, SACSIN